MTLSLDKKISVRLWLSAALITAMILFAELLGEKEIIFPEIDIDKIDRIQGMDITFVTSARTDKEAMSLLKQFGLPFKNQQK